MAADVTSGRRVVDNRGRIVEGRRVRGMVDQARALCVVPIECRERWPDLGIVRSAVAKRHTPPSNRLEGLAFSDRSPNSRSPPKS